MIKSVISTFNVNPKKSGGEMEAVQIYPSTSFLDLPEMSSKEWDAMTKEAQSAQMDWEARIAEACANIYAEAGVK